VRPTAPTASLWTMAYEFDFAALDPRGRVTLAIEAKAKRGTSAKWATEMRRIIAARSEHIGEPAFLLVTPDRLYVWPASVPPDAAPAASIDAETALGSYFARAGVPDDRVVSAQVFEDIVEWWLRDLVTGVSAPPPIASFDPVASALRGTRTRRVKIYAETNFVLELVLEQSEEPPASELIRLAGERRVELVLPTLAPFEAFSTIYRRGRERADLVGAIDRELAQVGRMLSLAEEASRVRGVLASASQLVTERYSSVRQILLQTARWIPLTPETLARGAVIEREHGLATPDAIVLASVLEDAAATNEPGLFVTKDSKDFDDPDIRAALEAVGCEPLFSITAALQRVLRSTPAPPT
jgi:predicted nucleic acid-binding protein